MVLLLESDIGSLAGQIWQHLEQNGESSTLQIRTQLHLSHSLLFLALGWLAREEKINLIQEERGYRVALKK